jgi:hypothetical protein
MKTVCKLANVDFQSFEEVYSLRKIEVMIAFSKKTSRTIVDEWKAAFDAMIADGTLMKIKKRWNIESDDPPFPEIEN